MLDAIHQYILGIGTLEHLYLSLRPVCGTLTAGTEPHLSTLIHHQISSISNSINNKWNHNRLFRYVSHDD